MRTSLAVELKTLAEGQGGWLGFDQFMGLALTHPREGYYSRARSDDQPEGPFGAQGDFVTAPMLGPWLGLVLAQKFVNLRLQATQLALCPDDLSITEFGPGSGALAAALLLALARAEALPSRYEIVEISPALVDLQRQTIRTHLSEALGGHQAEALLQRVTWAPYAGRRAGLVIANEVADALPVKRFEWCGPDHPVLEWGLVLQQGQLTWQTRPAEAELEQAVRRRHRAYRAARADLPNWRMGHQGEWSPWLKPWIHSLVDGLSWGECLVLDYGYERVELDHADRSRGTLVGHLRHQRVEDWQAMLAQPGQMDLTAHVDFTDLAEALQPDDSLEIDLQTQVDWLLEHGVLQMAQDRLFNQGADVGQVPTDPVKLRQLAGLQTLLSDAAMGQCFLVMTAARLGSIARSAHDAPQP
jgi:SAM-dependent MidA family methyltransferase